MENGRDAYGLKALNRHALEQIVAASAAGVLVADAQNPLLPVVYVNSAYERLTGFASPELVGTPWRLFAGAGEGAELERLRAAVARGESCRATVTDRSKDGAPLVSEVSVTPLHNARGELRYVLCLQHEPIAQGDRTSTTATNLHSPFAVVSAGESRARPKVAPTDRTDPATGLLRLDLFLEMFQRDLAVAQRERRVVTLLALEIVDFDTYSQTFGDKAAESCQRMVGAQITRTLRRAGDLSARYDDSTLIVAVVGQGPDELQPLADQIVANVRGLALHNPRGKASRYITVRASLASCAPGAYSDPARVIAEALSGARGGEPKLRAVLA